MSDTAGRSFVWAMIESGGLSILALVMLLVVARIVGPTEFGIAALVLGIIQILVVFVETLLHDAIVQRQHLSSRHLDTAFWTCSTLGFVLAAACWLGSDAIARLFDSPVMAPLLSVAGISLAFSGLGSVPLAMLRRERKFKPIAIRSLYARLFGAAVAVPLIVLDYGVWSLIIQHLVQTALNTLLIWPASSWWPRLRFSTRRLARLLSFGLYAVGSRIVWISSARIFMMFVGYFIGVSAAGTLNIAQRVVETPFDVLAGAGYNLALPYFSRRQNDRPALVRIYRMTLNFAGLTTFPIFIGLMICTPSIVELLLGSQWHDAIPLVRVLAIAATFHFIVMFAQVAATALGRPDIIFLSSLLSSAWVVVLFLVVRPDSAFGASILWASRAVLAGPMILITAHRLLGVSGRDVVAAVAAPAAAVMIMVGVLSTVDQSLPTAANAVVELITLVGLGAVVYGAAICLLDEAAVRRLGNFILTGIFNSKRP